jgi:ubiquinone/menaquinone biosynthesis C-methylase UbiE
VTDYDAHFARLAPSYDALRGHSRADTLRELVRLADLRGRTLVDIGCGTGADAAALATDHGVRVRAAVDASEEMLAVARERLGATGTKVLLAHAEELPFAAGSFERATMNTVVHLLDRPRAFAEAVRVLDSGGRLGIVTIDPAAAGSYWLAAYFPSFARIDSERFPSAESLERDLRAAGFATVAAHPSPLRLSRTREQALAMLHGRFASSFALMDEDEIAAGIERAEAELPPVVETTLARLIVVATRE